jgi:hypothetical protein
LAGTMADHPINEAVRMLEEKTEPGSRIYVLRGPHDPVNPPEFSEPAIFGAFMHREWIGTETIVPTLAKYGNKGVGTSFELENAKGTKETWRAFRDLWEPEYLVFPTRLLNLYQPWLDEVEHLADAGGYSLYRVNGTDHDRFLVGVGRVESTLNRLRFSDVQSRGGTIVVAYHYSKALRIKGESTGLVKRRVMPGESFGFLEIVHPPRNFEVIFDLDTAEGQGRE